MAALARAAWGPDTVVDFQDYGRGDSEVSFGARSILRDVRMRIGPIRERIRQYDVILDTGAGDSFTDIYGPKRLLTMLYAQSVAFSEGKPVVMGPQTIGPFSRATTKAAARRSLRRMTTVLARDSESAEYSRLELRREPDAVVTDVVFALPRPEATQNYDVLLNVSGLLWFSDAHVGSQRYQSLVRDLVTVLAHEGRHVSLLAHVVNPVSIADDRAAIDELRRQVSSIDQVIVPATLTEVRAAVTGARVVIGSRMHACLNALSSGTPAIPWAYSRKFAPLFRDIGWNHSLDLRTDEDVVQATVNLMTPHNERILEADLAKVLAQVGVRLETAIATIRRSTP